MYRRFEYFVMTLLESFLAVVELTAGVMNTLTLFRRHRLWLLKSKQSWLDTMGMTNTTHTSPAFFKNTLLLSLLMPSTSRNCLDGSLRSAIVSPGTIFQYFILSIALTDLIFCS